LVSEEPGLGEGGELRLIFLDLKFDVSEKSHPHPTPQNPTKQQKTTPRELFIHIQNETSCIILVFCLV